MKRIFLIALIFFVGSCDFPHDPQNSFANAQQHGLKVGVVHNPPFVDEENGNFSGSEVEILKEFAEKENLQIEFFTGSESTLVQALENYELQIIAGGFEKKTLWKKKAGLTTPYDKHHVFLIPKGENKLLQRLESFILKRENQI